jgi:ribonucleoside-triphosphate reductase
MSKVETAKRINQIDQEIVKLGKKLETVEGRKCEVYTRIVGYHRVVDNWNLGKKSEWKDRRTYTSSSFQQKKAS